MKKHKKEIIKWIAYISIAIPLSFSLSRVLNNNNKILFWVFIGIMGVSGVIARWAGVSDKKNKLLVAIQHIAFVSAITLFIWSLITFLF